MFVAKVVREVRRLAGLWERDGPGALTPAGQFRKILERERGRSDRTGEWLSMVAFTPRSPEARPVTLACLARILPKRLRSTDEIGWLDDEQVACLLPSTAAEGAWTVAHDVCRAFPDDVPAPICTVYSYPGKSSAKDGATALEASPERKPAGAVVALESLLMRPLPVWKRWLDMVGAAGGLLASLPVFAAVAFAVKLTSPGPVFFRQWRSGRGGKPFVMYKFRTMDADAEAKKRTLLGGTNRTARRSS